MNDIRRFLEDNKERMVELQKILTAIPAMAPEANGDGESAKAAALEKWLRTAGFSDIEVFNAPDSRVSSGVRPNIVVTLPCGVSKAVAADSNDSGDGNSSTAAASKSVASDSNEKFPNAEERIWIMAHLDVVPPGEISLWKTNPWECVEKDGKLFGRGVEDNQQGLVSAVFAGLYFIENKIAPKYTMKLLFAADEENGSDYGCRWLVQNTNLFRKSDLVIIPDGGDENGETIEIAEKNLLWLRFHVQGKQTHGSRPDSGVNACLAADDLALRIHGLEKKFNKTDSLFEPNYTTIQPTKREKNVDGINIIPGEDIFYMDCRILPCYALSEILASVDETCRQIESEYGVKVEYTTPQKAESPATPADSKVVKVLSEAIFKAHGKKTRCIGIGGGTVGSELRREGIDCAVWSTLCDMAHQPNEYCIVDNMVKDAVTIATMFAD